MAGGAGNGASPSQCASGTVVSAATAYLFSSVNDNAATSTTTMYLNGAQTCQNTAVVKGFVNTSLTSIGAEGYGSPITANADGYLTGDVAEIIIYNVPLSVADIQIVECYLASKYNINISAGHTCTGLIY